MPKDGLGIGGMSLYELTVKERHLNSLSERCPMQEITENALKGHVPLNYDAGTSEVWEFPSREKEATN